MKNSLAKKIEQKAALLKKMGVSITDPDEPLYPGSRRTFIVLYDRVSLALLTHPVEIMAGCYINHATLLELVRQCVRTWYITREEMERPRRRDINEAILSFYYSYFSGRPFNRLKLMLEDYISSGSADEFILDDWEVDETRQRQVYADLCRVEAFHRRLRQAPITFSKYNERVFLNQLKFWAVKPQAQLYAEKFWSEVLDRESKFLWLLHCYNAYHTETMENCVVWGYALMAVLMAAIGIKLAFLNQTLSDQWAHDWDGSVVRYGYSLFSEDASWMPVGVMVLILLASAAYAYHQYHSRDHDLFGLKTLPLRYTLKDYRWDNRPESESRKRVAYSEMHSFFKLRATRAPNFHNVDTMRDAFQHIRRDVFNR